MDHDTLNIQCWTTVQSHLGLNQHGSDGREQSALHSCLFRSRTPKPAYCIIFAVQRGLSSQRNDLQPLVQLSIFQSKSDIYSQRIFPRHIELRLPVEYPVFTSPERETEWPPDRYEEYQPNQSVLRTNWKRHSPHTE